MTIKELIEELSKYPLDLPVYDNDSEYGAEEIEGITLMENVLVWHRGNLVKLTYIRIP